MLRECPIDKDVFRSNHDRRLTRAPGTGAPIGGVEIVIWKGWFATRTSGIVHNSDGLDVVAGRHR
jgi:phosphoglucomutase